MRVNNRSIYRGPHLHSGLPMIRFELDLETLETYPTNTLPGLTDRLLDILPGLRQHGCSTGRPGGLIERMRIGTWIGHVVEHVALELQALVGAGVTRGKTRSVTGKRGCYNVMFAYRDEAVGLLAGRIALETVHRLLPDEHRLDHEGRPAEIVGIDLITRAPESSEEDGGIAGFAALRTLAAKYALGPTTQSIIDAARVRGIPVERLDGRSLLRLGHGVSRRLVRASITGQTSHLAVESAGNKSLTKQLLAEAELPVPAGVVVTSADEAVRAAQDLGEPVVIKPLDGNHGRGVSVGVTGEAQLRQAYADAASINQRVIVEQQFRGRDYRVLVIGGRVVAVAERMPAYVVGDGARTLAALIDELNSDPRRGIGHEKPMTRVAVDARLRRLVREQGCALTDVPQCGRVVVLRETANLSTGGEAIDRTDEIHESNRRVAQLAAKVIGLDVAGLDIISPDLGRPLHETGGGIVEVNAAPGFRMHLNPSEGRSRDVAGCLVDALVPPWSKGRIPIIAVTGTNGKTTVARMVSHIMAHAGHTVGMTTTSGIEIDGHLIKACDASGPRSARTVLAHPNVDVAVLETARGGILREGLGYDLAHVGIVMNVTPDHIGLGGADTLDDLAQVKSVVARQVHAHGVSVLNADDPLVKRMAPHAGGTVAFITTSGRDHLSEDLTAHLARGGVVATTATTPAGESLVIIDGDRTHDLLPVARIPATIGGAAHFNVHNALAAALAAYAQGVSVSTIASALGSFESTFEQNPGRLNMTVAPGCTTILDYAHNPAALTAFGELLTTMRPRYRRLIGVVSIPGDRRDEDIREMGRISAGLFDFVVFRERPDGRGRAAGGVVRLLAEGAVRAGMNPTTMRRILDEYEAIDVALGEARADDLVAIMPTNVEGAWAWIQSYADRQREGEHSDGDVYELPIETTAGTG